MWSHIKSFFNDISVWEKMGLIQFKVSGENIWYTLIGEIMILKISSNTVKWEMQKINQEQVSKLFDNNVLPKNVEDHRNMKNAWKGLKIINKHCKGFLMLFEEPIKFWSGIMTWNSFSSKESDKKNQGKDLTEPQVEDR